MAAPRPSCFPSLNGDIVSFVLFTMFLLAAFAFKFAVELLSFFAVFVLCESSWRILEPKLGRRVGRSAAAALLGAATLGLISGGAFAMLMLARDGQVLIGFTVAQLFELGQQLQSRLPELDTYIPDSKDLLGEALGDLLKGQWPALFEGAKGVATHAVKVALACVVSIMCFWAEKSGEKSGQEGAAATGMTQMLRSRASEFASAVGDVLFAQAKISGVNAIFTALFLLVALPLFEIKLPFAMLLAGLVFFFGLIPILGNLVTNGLIVISASTVSLAAAGICLIYLIVIHKLEYFLNAKIMGTKISVPPWEVLAWMLVMESIFGLPGILFAPIVCAWIRSSPGLAAIR